MSRVIAGKPLAVLLLQRDATVTICHCRTANLAALTRQNAVLLAAAGRANLIPMTVAMLIVNTVHAAARASRNCN